MTKKIVLFLILVMALVFGMMAAGCDNGNGGEDNVVNEFTITYDAGEGSGTPPASQKIVSGVAIYLPGQGDMSAPSGKIFNGWRSSGKTYSAGDSFKVTDNALFLAQWIINNEIIGGSGKEGGGGNGDEIIITKEPLSVQEALNNAVVKQESASAAEFQSANYDPDLGYIVLTYKVGTIKDMFLQYLSAVVAAEAGREFTYTEISGHSEIMQTENINTTAMNFSGTIWAAGAGAIAGANVFAGLGSLSGLGTKAKTNAYAAAGAAAGKFRFDFESVSTTMYTETYQKFLNVSNSFKQDMSIYPAGRKYAVAAFADVGIYQILKYDPQTRTAAAIPGKSLWFNVESRPYWNMYEYSKEVELSIPQQLKPFEKVNVTVTDADLFKSIKAFTETRSNPITYIGGNFNEIKKETFNHDLLLPILKHLGYTKLRINVSFDYQGHQIWSKYCATLRVMIENHNNTELGRSDFSCKHEQTRASFSTVVSIDSLNSNTGQFRILWRRIPDGHIFSWPDEFWVGNRTITITAE